jgi:hypothetical protein
MIPWDETFQLCARHTYTVAIQLFQDAVAGDGFENDLQTAAKLIEADRRT